ncbi:MAG: bifunctional allantoicase/(S)-ureidoglycine aminohydrolase [Ahrensia sp.]|nr:bifunctional allantoicase/(S)-ureidoglycine aminohydrolase [Ahrensia sp.]
MSQSDIYTYATPPGGLPSQSEKMTGRAIFTESYAFLPAGTMRDIVTSYLPHWNKTRAWIIARPMTGFAETFAQYIVEVSPSGGSDNPEPEIGAEAVLFVVDGTLELTIDGTLHNLSAGGYAFIAPHAKWSVVNSSDAKTTFHWIRKLYEEVEGIDLPTSFVTHDAAVQPTAMPDTQGKWATTRFVDPADLRHDMHVTIVTFQPGGVIPFEETHVMEHGLYVLQGKATYLLNKDWVEVEAGDFMWLRAFCPQACYAAGNEPFRYLLYKDVNRHPALRLP